MLVQEIRNDTLGGGFKSYSPLLWEDPEIDKYTLLPTNQEIQFKECCNRDIRMTLPDQFSGNKNNIVYNTWTWWKCSMDKIYY